MCGGEHTCSHSQSQVCQRNRELKTCRLLSLYAAFLQRKLSFYGRTRVFPHIFDGKRHNHKKIVRRFCQDPYFLLKKRRDMIDTFIF